MVFHALSRDHRDTILCPWISYILLLYTCYGCTNDVLVVAVNPPFIFNKLKENYTIKKTVQVPHYHRSALVWQRYPSSQVSEGSHHLQGAPIGVEGPDIYLPLLLCCYSPSLPLHALVALFCVYVRPLRVNTRRHHVSQGSPWVGEVALLQDHYGVPDVPVPEVHPCHNPCQRPTTKPYEWKGL